MYLLGSCILIGLQSPLQLVQKLCGFGTRPSANTRRSGYAQLATSYNQVYGEPDTQQLATASYIECRVVPHLHVILRACYRSFLLSGSALQRNCSLFFTCPQSASQHDRLSSIHWQSSRLCTILFSSRSIDVTAGTPKRDYNVFNHKLMQGLPFMASADKICCGNKTKFAKDRNCVQYNSKSESNSTKQIWQKVSNLSPTVPFQNG